MKSLIQTIILSALCSTAIAQTLPVDTARQQVDWTEVIQVDGATSNDLYNRARMWFVNNYKSADDVLQLEDREGGRLSGKAFTVVRWHSGIANFRTRLYYTISISCRDGRYKYQITDLYYKSYAEGQLPSVTSYPNQWYIPSSLMFRSNGKPKKTAVNYHDHTFRELKATSVSLKTGMSVATAVDTDDW